MTVEDVVLPAAVHLTGPHAGDVLRPAVEQAGGELLRHRSKSVHYRRGSSLVVQFRADVSWHGGPVQTETLLAGTTAAGPPDSTVPVVADTDDGNLAVGVWRWPFDPGLPALESAVHSLDELLAGVIPPGTRPAVKVVAYRPMERAVVRVRSEAGTWYLKVVSPASTPVMLERIRIMHAHDIPVPAVSAADVSSGWVLLREVAGPTLRDLVKSDAATWVRPAAVAELVGRISAIDADGPPALRSRLAEAPFHLSLLEAVMPEEEARLAHLIAQFDEAVPRAGERARTFVHGDLHESQLVVTDGSITGVLDVDESGLGDPIDDLAVPVGHLRFRAASAPNGDRINAFVDELIGAFGAEPDDVAIGAAAVLAGLAAASFRSQRGDWRTKVSSGLDLVEQELPAGSRGLS